MSKVQSTQTASQAAGAAFSLVEVLGVFGFLISLGLAGVKIWETFFRASRFDAYFEWAQSEGDYVLEFHIANVGWKKDSIRSAFFRTPFRKLPDPHDRDSTDWQFSGPSWEAFPLVLDVDEVTPPVWLPLSALVGSLKGLSKELNQGTAKLIVINARNQESLFDIPKPGSGPPAPTPDELGP